MKACEAMIVWNDHDVDVVKWGSSQDVGYENVGGAVNEYWREAKDHDRLLRWMFNVLTADFEIDANTVDNAFRKIESYRMKR
jgi:hypothetical protein